MVSMCLIFLVFFPSYAHCFFLSFYTLQEITHDCPIPSGLFASTTNLAWGRDIRILQILYYHLYRRRVMLQTTLTFHWDDVAVPINP
jgi:hypothetical protein